jgi:hypothetical protein
MKILSKIKKNGKSIKMISKVVLSKSKFNFMNKLIYLFKTNKKLFKIHLHNKVIYN